ncbi:MAG: VWA domain-containing protein [Gemmatimonadetes bacterium]|nr:VWA domain-containing protein [Gemmatimonadota bacterium]
MSFARPDLMFLIVFLPLLLAGAVWLYARRRERIARAFSDAHLLTRLGGDDLLRFPLPRLVILMVAGASLGMAAAGPRWGYTSAEGQTLSLNVVIATDISKSMLVPDVEPNRLERARLFARRMLRELPGDRFGLVVFAGRAYILSPLTSDHSALELYLDALDPEMVSQGGSSLAAAIAQATDLVRGSETSGGERAVVLLSDGEALEDAGGVEAAADRAARAGVRFLTIGVGTPAGDRVPDIDPASGQVVGYKRDEAGQMVVSRLDEDLLRTVAERTGGRYVRMDDAAALSRVIGELQGMQRERGENAQRTEARDRFALFAALALIMLALDMILYGGARIVRSEPAAASGGVADATDGDATGAGIAAVGSAYGSRRPSKRRAVQTAVLVLMLIGTGYGIGDLEKGNRLYREGKYEEAVAAYQRVVDSGKASPQVHYNLGTALLALGRFQDADAQFQRALQGIEPELRERAFYNLGNRFLEDARAHGDVRQQGELLDAAIEAYKRSLRIDPQDVDAKWNLEMALREREQNEQQQQSMPQQQDQEQDQEDESEQDQQQQAGGGSGSSDSESPAGEGQDSGTAMEDQPMSEEQADRILSAIEQDERDLTREKLRRGQRRVPVLRDW